MFFCHAMKSQDLKFHILTEPVPHILQKPTCDGTLCITNWNAIALRYIKSQIQVARDKTEMAHL